MRKLALLLVIALALCGQAAAQGQGNVARAKGIEKALKAKDVKRKLKESINGGHYVEQDWAIGSHRLSIVINEYASPEEAARMVELAERGVAAVEVKEHLHGVGDEATYNTNRRGTHTSLMLRKGNIVVSIWSTSLKAAKAFAKDIADELAR
jgi:hypothetical protein